MESELLSMKLVYLLFMKSNPGVRDGVSYGS